MKTGSSISWLAMVAGWVCGIALVKGFWMTTLCVVVPPVAWVILAQHVIGV